MKNLSTNDDAIGQGGFEGLMKVEMKVKHDDETNDQGVKEEPIDNDLETNEEESKDENKPEKPFWCGICGKAFSTLNSLKRHSKIHDDKSSDHDEESDAEESKDENYHKKNICV